MYLSVGGIYTVIRSKAGVTTAELGDHYCLIGPYNEACVRLEVEVMEPEHPVMKDTVEAMRSEGVKVRKRKRRGYLFCFIVINHVVCLDTVYC